MLVREPNFLILDEPSNYLDLSTLLLLERFLADFNGGYAIVSHDREFLKRTCEETLEIEDGAMTLWPGGVHDYLIFKYEEKERKEAFNRNLSEKKARMEKFVERFKAKASKASQARSRVKALEKLEAKFIEIDHPLATVRIRLPRIEHRTGHALQTDNLAIGYPGRTVADLINLEIHRGEKIAILGNNGEGKTTLLRTLAGELPSKSGGFKWAAGMAFSYYAQHVYSALDPGLTVRESLRSMASRDVNEQQILDLAGCFLFRGDDVDKKVKVLSGGERSRVCLAGLLLAKKPVLLLDEPTNHLDFETVEALASALAEYAGTVIFVCHDRTFVRLTATRIVEIRNGKVRNYPGTYEEYVWSLGHDDNTSEPAPSTADRTLPSTQTKEKTRYEARKELAADRRKALKAMEQNEAGQAKLKSEIAGLHTLLETDPAGWTREKAERYETAKVELTCLEDDWLRLHDELARLDGLNSD
jgi:ATP-binding cassette subfamily F protein 3